MTEEVIKLPRATQIGYYEEITKIIPIDDKIKRRFLRTIHTKTDTEYSSAHNDTITTKDTQRQPLLTQDQLDHS